METSPQAVTLYAAAAAKQAMSDLPQADIPDGAAVAAAQQYDDDHDPEHPSPPTDSINVQHETPPETARHARLLDLPPEIRNDIYFYILLEEAPIDVPSSGKVVKPAVLKVCRQRRKEASPIYYGQNVFHVHADINHSYFSGPEIWLRSLTLEARRSIRSLTLLFPVSDERRSVNDRLMRARALGSVTCKC